MTFAGRAGPELRRGISCALLALLAACGSGGQQASPPPPIVETMVVRTQSVPNIIELPGRIEAVRTAEVRARTDGIVLRRLYEEGSIVREGTPLFQIDARDYRAQVEQAQGTLQRAQALRSNAASVVRRYDPLVGERSISAQEYDAAQSSLLQADAQVTEARAALSRSRLLLDYTTIRAPISGRVGQAEVTEGALVSAGQATLMTQVDQISPVYAVFSASSASLLDLMAQIRSGELRLASPQAVTVKLVLENGADYPLTGRIDFTGSIVDPSTGSQTVRAQFANGDGLLAPGQFVRGRFDAGTITDGMMLPSRAVQFTGEQAMVSVLGKDGTVAARPVTLGSLTGGNWIIRSGVRPGERIIVDGWQKVRPGQKAMDAEEAKKAMAAQAAKGGGQ